MRMLLIGVAVVLAGCANYENDPNYVKSVLVKEQAKTENLWAASWVTEVICTYERVDNQKKFTRVNKGEFISLTGDPSSKAKDQIWQGADPCKQVIYVPK